MRSLSLFAAAVTTVAAVPQRGGGWNHGWGNGPWNHPGWTGGHHGYNQTGESQQEARQRAAAVKEMFEVSWAGYYKYDRGLVNT